VAVAIYLGCRRIEEHTTRRRLCETPSVLIEEVHVAATAAHTVVIAYVGAYLSEIYHSTRPACSRCNWELVRWLCLFLGIPPATP
jgi:hypothetical protein